MQVKLVSITKSLVLDNLQKEKELSAEELLVYIARVSNPSNQLNTETSDKLIGYMIKNKHWSPFDMVNMTIEITTSRAIAHQILRHWSIKPQEFSQRYAEATNYEPIQLRLSANKNRQSSSEEISIIDIEDNSVESKRSEQYFAEISMEILKAAKECDRVYKKAISLGIAKECARMILPLTTSTTMYLNGSVRSWIHYLEQRCDLHAQLEHRQSAELIKEIFKQNFPSTSLALGI